MRGGDFAVKVNIVCLAILSFEKIGHAGNWLKGAAPDFTKRLSG